MRNKVSLCAAIISIAIAAFSPLAQADSDPRFFSGRDNEFYDGHGHYDFHGQRKHDDSVQLGPRPFYLVEVWTTASSRTV